MLKAKNCVVGSKIYFKINGEVNDAVGMIVNEDYEGCFMEEKADKSKYIFIQFIENKMLKLWVFLEVYLHENSGSRKTQGDFQ